MTEPTKAVPQIFKINEVDYLTVEGVASLLEIEPYEVRNLVHYHRRLVALKVSIATMITVESLKTEAARRGIVIPELGEVTA